MTGVIQADAQAAQRGLVLVDIGKVEAVLPQSEQVPGEQYTHGTRLALLRGRRHPRDARAAGDGQPHPPEPGARSCSRSRCPRSPTAASRSSPWPARPGTAARSRSVRPSPASTPRAPASVRWVSGCATSWPNCTARRSTSSTGPRTRPPTSATRSRPRTRCVSTVVDPVDAGGAGRRARLPALAGDRARGAERPARGPADRLADRHPQRRRRCRPPAAATAGRRRRRSARHARARGVDLPWSPDRRRHPSRALPDLARYSGAARSGPASGAGNGRRPPSCSASSWRGSDRSAAPSAVRRPRSASSRARTRCVAAPRPGVRRTRRAAAGVRSGTARARAGATRRRSASTSRPARCRQRSDRRNPAGVNERWALDEAPAMSTSTA